MAGHKAGAHRRGDYTIDLHFGANGISGSVWWCETKMSDGSTIGEHVSDFPTERTLSGAVAVAEKIIRLDRNGRKERT